MTETTTTYFRLDFENCGLDYDYAICKDHSEVNDYLQKVETDLEWDGEDQQPCVKITTVAMTETQYEKYVKQMEERA